METIVSHSITPQLIRKYNSIKGRVLITDICLIDHFNSDPPTIIILPTGSDSDLMITHVYWVFERKKFPELALFYVYALTTINNELNRFQLVSAYLSCSARMYFLCASKGDSMAYERVRERRSETIYRVISTFEQGNI